MSDKRFEKIWDFFGGHIRCINLKYRKDRYKASKAVFDEYNIPVKYFKTTKHPKGGVYGCFTSHIKVIKEAYYAGAKRVLIFEDDISPTDYLTPQHLEKAINFMKKEGNNWDLFYLGAFPNIRTYRSERTKYKDIYRLRGICAHAYIVNRKAMKRLINLKYEGMAIDYIYVNCFPKSYALYPTLFYQGLYESDLGYNFWADYGTPDRISTFYRCMECYAYYVNYPLIIFVPILITIIAWFLCGMYNRYHWLCLVSLILAIFIFVILFWCDQKPTKHCK